MILSRRTMLAMLPATLLIVGTLDAARAEASDPFPDTEERTEGRSDARREPAMRDPLEPWNRLMFRVNDTLYFWVFKPVARGYGAVVPSPARRGVRHAFANLAMPGRAVNCLLQGKWRGAGIELARFGVNSTIGVLGFTDAAATCEPLRTIHDEDFGQTLGRHGIGTGFFITWPLFGPSTMRDTVGMLGDMWLDPVTHLDPWALRVGLRMTDRVNDTSLRLGQYEALKAETDDPYAALREAYARRRHAAIAQ